MYLLSSGLDRYSTNALNARMIYAIDLRNKAMPIQTDAHCKSPTAEQLAGTLVTTEFKLKEAPLNKNHLSTSMS
jgi:hypothetical protein